MILNSLSRGNPLTPLAPVQQSDSEEVKEIGQKFGGRAAYADEIAGLVASICSPEFGWSMGGMISANGGLSFSL